MCQKCHRTFSDVEISEQLNDAILNPQFHVWNSTSINHLIIIANGHNGEKNSELAKQLLKDFESYRSNL